jgi:autotransporter-associated beta strand protein
MKPNFCKNRFLLLQSAALALLVNHANAETKTWDGSNSTNWSTGTNWQGGIAPVAANTADDFIFREAASGNTITNIFVDRQIKSLTFNSFVTTAFEVRFNVPNNNAARNLTMGDGSNAGAITVDSGAAGNITIGKGGGAVTGNLILANNLAVAQNSTTSTLTIDAPITESGGARTLTKSGSGTLILSGANTYTGTTTVSGGKLTVASAGSINGTNGVTIGTASTAATAEFNYNSSTALTKAVSFAADSTGGTLSGTGTINLAVNVTDGNTLAIGNGNIGAMAFGNNLEVGGTFLHELMGGGSTADLGDVAGNLTLGGILDLVQLGTYTLGNKFTLFAYDGTLSGLFKDFGGVTDILDDTNFTDAGGIWKLNYNDTTAGLNGGVSASNTYVTITAIPEPNVAALLGGLGTILLLRRRRR